jgi:cytochrome P450
MDPVFAELDVHRHAYLRKRATAAFTMTSILSYERYIQHSLDTFLQKLAAHAGTRIDLSWWMNSFTFDCAGQLAFGEPIGMLDDEKDAFNLRAQLFEGVSIMASVSHWNLTIGKRIITAMSLLNSDMMKRLIVMAGQEVPMEGFVQ